MKYLLYLFFLISISSACSTSNHSINSSSNYYLCYIDQDVNVYPDNKLRTKVFTVPANRLIIVKHTTSKYRYIWYGDFEGYIVKRKFPTEVKYTPEELQHLVFTKDSTYQYIRNIPDGNQSSSYSNSSNINSSSDSRINTPSKSSPGTEVHVKGYYRKNGTYVRPHTRSAPRRH